MKHRYIPLLWRVGVLLLSIAPAGCREPVMTLGVPPAAAHAEELFASFALRATNPVRDAQYDTARMRITPSAMIPSRVWRDSAIWTSVTPTMRQLLVHGYFAGGQYHMDAATSVPFPDAPADARHRVDLTRLSDDEYRWETDVPFAIGHLKAEAVGRYFATTFASAEGRTESQVRQDYTTYLPRTTAVAGRLFRADSIRSIPLADRSWTSTYAVTMTPEGIEKQYPELARYLRRYVHSAKVHLALDDSSGARYLEITIQNGHMVVRTRSAGGHMLALYGPARLMPDSLILAMDLTVRVRGFTVGFRNYRGELRIVSTPRERAWDLVSRREPDWVLPLITERLIRTPLRRPFRGEGAWFRIGVRDTAGAQSILARELRVEVQESAILRFIGRLSATAISDYAGKVEAQEMAYLKELFDAMIEDLGRS